MLGISIIMDVLEKNMIATTTQNLLNYGGLDKNKYTIVGQITSDLPFSLTIIADNVIVPFGYDLIQTAPYTISFNSMENLNVSTIDACSSFELQFDTPNQKEINLKLWKPYPISPFT
jgi:hypothetical protein